MTSVFQKFGGIRPMAAKIGKVPPSTVKSWQVNGQIPSWRHESILDAAKREGIPLSRQELEKLAPDTIGPGDAADATRTDPQDQRAGL